MRAWLVCCALLLGVACDDGGGSPAPADAEPADGAPLVDAARDAAIDARPDVPLDGAPPAPDAAADAHRPVDHPAQRPPEVAQVAPGVMRAPVVLDGAIPPPNPETGGATPPALNRARYSRYYAVDEPPPRAIVVGVPGVLAGAGSLEPLAVALVRRAAEAGRPIEVWAVDRRANALEDLRGLDTAEVVGDPEIAWGYHFGDTTIDGSPFAGFIDSDQLDYLSEWGLAVHVEDVRRIIAQVPADLRRGHVFLMGHSLGAMFAEIYAGWRFDPDTSGADELAGLILLDGAPAETPSSEAEWRTGSNLGIFAQPGISR